jgi:AcrR family transcriptional regulator
MNEPGERRPKARRTRADARRNREQILRAAADLIIEQGPTATMELIARRARVGIATLYRHFPDRTSLLRQVALDALHTNTEVATAALAEEPDAFTALARYLHDSIDLRVGAVLLALAGRLATDDDLLDARRQSRKAHNALITAAHQEGSLRPDVTAGDIALLGVRVTPPLSAMFSTEDNHRLSHRQLEVILDGLLRFASNENLPGPAFSFDDILQLGPGPDNGAITNDIHAGEPGRWWPRKQ